jgi:hypothetical protein
LGFQRSRQTTSVVIMTLAIIIGVGPRSHMAVTGKKNTVLCPSE